VVVFLGVYWLVKQVYQGRARLPDFLSASIVRLVDGPEPRTTPTRYRQAIIDLGDSPVAEVDPRFLSVAIDTSLIVGGHWWSPSGAVEATGRARVSPLDLKNANLRQLARELAPAYLRVGGTEADKVFYAVQPDAGTAPGPGEIPLSRECWEGLLEFVRSSGLELFFTLNAGPGRRDAKRRWKPENAEQLLRYAHTHAQPIGVIEFGNEINGYWFSFGVLRQPSGTTVAEDLVRLRGLRDRYAPNSLLVAPGEFFWPRLGSPLAQPLDVLRELVVKDRGRNLDAITWHYYPQQSRRCPVATRRASLTGLLDPAALDEVSRWANRIRTHRDTVAASLPIWLGETGGAQCGGEPGVSDRFASSLWWLDQLSLLALHAQQVVVRQSLVGSNYGLLDDVTMQPRPDYYASILHKRLMGTRVLGVRRSPDSDPYLRVYAHCAPQHRGHACVTVLAINLHQHESSVLGWPRVTGHGIDVYQVTAASLDSPTALLNGQPITFDGSSIALEPARVRSDGHYTLPPISYTFLTACDLLTGCGGGPRN